MYARKVSLCLKPESASQFLNKVEHEVIPLFRKHKGFLDHLIVISENGKIVYVYTFWKNAEDADRYDSTTLPALNPLLTAVVDGELRVHAFGGSRDRLSGGLPPHQS
jgi:hypothetical protein